MTLRSSVNRALGKAGKPLVEIGKRAYSTPLFDAGDPLVCHELALRPSLWEAVWTALENMGEAWSWRQDDPAHATVDEVTAEIAKAVDSAVFRGCTVIGQVIELAIDCPDWCLECDGTTYLNADYPLLAAVIDSAFIVDGTHFKVPDHQSRFALGETVLGSQGGESSHTLTTGEIPGHTHTEVTTGITGLFVAPGEVPAVIAAGAGVTGSTGGGGAHNNMPPYETIRKVIVARYPYA